MKEFDFAYDAWGRAVSKSWAKDPATTHTATYTWQMGDKLRRIETDFPGERDVWYNCDGLGKRRNKLFANPDDLHWYRWAGWSVLSEYDTAGASGWEVPAAAARVDVAGLAGLAERGAGAAYAYRLHDHLGSVRGLRGASKAPLARYAYAPYGELNHGAGRPLRRGFTGHHWDAESGMYYAPFRYYMPGAGRWLSRDPLGFVDGPNVYGYVGASPVRYVDPLGDQRKLPGRKTAPPGWPDPGKKWKWNKGEGCYEKGKRRRVWHPGGSPRGEGAGAGHPEGHGAPHWDEFDSDGGNHIRVPQPAGMSSLPLTNAAILAGVATIAMDILDSISSISAAIGNALDSLGNGLRGLPESHLIPIEVFGDGVPLDSLSVPTFYSHGLCP